MPITKKRTNKITYVNLPAISDFPLKFDYFRGHPLSLSRHIADAEFPVHVAMWQIS